MAADWGAGASPSRSLAGAPAAGAQTLAEPPPPPPPNNNSGETKARRFGLSPARSTQQPPPLMVAKNSVAASCRAAPARQTQWRRSAPKRAAASRQRRFISRAAAAASSGKRASRCHANEAEIWRWRPRQRTRVRLRRRRLVAATADKAKARPAVPTRPPPGRVSSSELAPPAPIDRKRRAAKRHATVAAAVTAKRRGRRVSTTMIDYASDQSGRASDSGAISRPKAQLKIANKFGLARGGCVAATLLVVCAMLSAATAAHAEPASAAAATRRFWLELVRPLGELAGAPQDAAERLAERLATWPDKRRAALHYMELLARRRRDADCRRVSLAELLAGASADGHLAPGGKSAHAAEELDVELQLELGRRAGAAAQLAVENANLISRLLAAAATTAATQTQGGANEDSAAQNSAENINGGGAFAESGHLSGAELLGPLATRNFFKYLLSSGARKLSGGGAPENASRALGERSLHSIGLVFFGGGGGGALEDEPPPALFAPLATFSRDGGVEVVDLARHPLAANTSGEPNSLFGGGGGGNRQPPASFLAKWLRLGNKLPDELGERQQLEPSDGRWFSPYFDCGLSNRWLLTYSVPLFGRRERLGHSRPSRRSRQLSNSVQFRGVSYVSLDLAATGLFDQCAPAAATADRTRFLANTHQCARLAASQCVRVAAADEDAALRPGAYVCQCKFGAKARKAELQANERRREQLADLVASRAASNSSHSFDALALEPLASNPFGDKRLVSAKLTGPPPPNRAGAAFSRQEQFFALGAQFEADATLDWFARPQAETETAAAAATETAAAAWPAQVCRPLGCDEDEAEREGESGAQRNASRAQSRCDEAAAEASGAQTGNWIRPLVLTVQFVCILLTLVLVIILLRVRRSRIVLAAGWLMLETMLVGALLLYASVLVRCFTPTSLTCLLEPWLRELGFSVFYGSILIKLYRLLSEFRTRKAHRVCLRDKDQAMYLLAIVLIVIGYMSAWTALMVDGFFAATATTGPAAGDSANSNSDGEPSAARLPAPLPLASQLGRRSTSAASEASVSFAAAAAAQTGDGNYLDGVSESANRRLREFARELSTFGELFSGLLEGERRFDSKSDTIVYSARCRKLTWDYVTESSEMGLLLFGLHLVYKLRNLTSDTHKEKLILCLAVFVELFVSAIAYAIRHIFWRSLGADHLLVLYAIRCQLSVTSTIALVFGPKLWTIGKGGRQTLFGGAAGLGGTRAPSARHRCHLTCELHDHHLDDASRLHQAMLSNSALEIGSISFADLDPDEVQAELKRVYTQLEMLKTKVMRRDNPHISKRRGGRKQGHRKFSLQAFHAKHSSSTDQQNTCSQSGLDGGGDSGAASKQQAAAAATETLAPPAKTKQSLSIVAELDDDDEGGGRAQKGAPPQSGGAKSAKHVRVANTIRQLGFRRAADELAAATALAKRGRSGGGGGSKRLPSSRNNRKRGSREAANVAGESCAPPVPDPVSTSSFNFDDDTLAANDASRSSGDSRR